MLYETVMLLVSSDESANFFSSESDQYSSLMEEHQHSNEQSFESEREEERVDEKMLQIQLLSFLLYKCKEELKRRK